MTSPERQRLFGIIDSLENDLADLISNQLLRTHFEEQIFGELVLSKALGRRDRDGSNSPAVTFTDFPEKVEAIQRWKRSLDPQVAEDAGHLGQWCESLYPIRNRVMHGRPLHPDDMGSVRLVAEKIASSEVPCFRLRATVEKLRRDPAWVPPGAMKNLGSLTLSNLPDSDYDDTGLMGRSSERDRLHRLLMDDRYLIVSVVAPGGVGKTALALEVLHSLADNPDSKFELIAWVSLKTEMLSPEGIEEVMNAVCSLEEAIPHLASALDPSAVTSTVESLSRLLEGIPALIVIDNLETVTGAEVLDFVERMPPGVRFLFTSRVGLGQGDKRLDLDPLAPKAGAALLRKLCENRGVDYLAKLSSEEMADLVEKIGPTPLALRWFAAGVESGLDAGSVLQRRGDLVAYCVQQVFDSMSRDAQKVAWTLYALSRPIPTPDLYSLLDPWPIDQVRRSIQELVKGMFLRRTALDGSIIERLELTDLLYSFMGESSNEDDWEDWCREVREQDAESQREADRLALDAEGGGTGPNIIAGGPEHRAAQVELRRALSLARKQSFDEALELVAHAKELDPLFFEVPRVEAFVLSLSGSDDARQSYERALELAPSSNRALVCHYYAGHLARSDEFLEKAEELAREANSALASSETAFGLATILRNKGSLDEACRLADQVASDASGPLDVRALTLGMNLRKRIAEDLDSGEGHYLDAFKIMLEAVELAVPYAAAAWGDPKLLREIVRSCSEVLSIASRNPDVVPGSDLVVTVVAALAPVLPWINRDMDYEWLRRYAFRFAEAQPERGAELVGLFGAGDDIESESTAGVVDWFNSGAAYGFVRLPATDETVFFHASDFAEPSDQVFALAGQRVRFKAVEDEQGRPRASSIEVVDPTRESLIDREAVVVHLRDGFCLGRDRRTGVTVFCGKHQFRDRSDWSALTDGSELVVDIERQDDGRLRAVDGSVRLQ